MRFSVICERSYILRHDSLSRWPAGDESPRQDYEDERGTNWETLPGESMGQRKGQATCSSPMRAIASLTHNYTRAQVKFSSSSSSRKPFPRFPSTTHVLLHSHVNTRVAQNVIRIMHCEKRGYSANLLLFRYNANFFHRHRDICTTVYIQMILEWKISIKNHMSFI